MDRGYKQVYQGMPVTLHDRNLANMAYIYIEFVSSSALVLPTPTLLVSSPLSPTSSFSASSTSSFAAALCLLLLPFRGCPLVRLGFILSFLLLTLMFPLLSLALLFAALLLLATELPCPLVF